MITATTAFETVRASRYLQQLCKHFAHRVDVEFDQSKGRVAFPGGTANLSAHPDKLKFVVHSEDVVGLDQTKSILENHIVRFAFRENLKCLEWSS